MLLMLAFCVHLSCPAQWTLLNAYSSEDIQSHAQSQLSLDALTSSLFTYDVEMRRLSYDMPFLGADTPVSGAAFLPNSAGTDLPVLVYHHGTTFQRQSAPSFKVDLTNLGYAMASMGFVVLISVLLCDEFFVKGPSSQTRQSGPGPEGQRSRAPRCRCCPGL